MFVSRSVVAGQRPLGAIPTPGQAIGIVLFDDVEELDAIDPWEVLAF